MGQGRVFIVKFIHLLRHGEDALVGVGGVQRCQLYTAEEELLYLHIVVLGHFLGNYLLHCLVDGLFIDVEIVLFERLLILARSILSGIFLCFLCLLFDVVVDSFLYYSHNVVVFSFRPAAGAARPSGL